MIVIDILHNNSYASQAQNNLLYERLRIKIDLMTYEIEFKIFIVLDKEVYEDYFAVYRALIS